MSEEQNQVKQAADAGLHFFDRLDFKGAELQAAMKLRGLLEGIMNGRLVVTPADEEKQSGNGSGQT